PTFHSASLFHPTPPPDIYTLSLHDALPILRPLQLAGTPLGFALSQCRSDIRHAVRGDAFRQRVDTDTGKQLAVTVAQLGIGQIADRKSTRLNSSHVKISYAVFCLKKKKKKR